MPFRDKLRELKSRVKSRISQTNQGNSGTPNQPSSTSGSGASSRWTHLKTFVTALEQATKPFPPLKAAISELAGSIANHDRMLSERKEYETLHSELEELFQALQKHCVETTPPAITATLDALCKSIQDEIANINQKKDKSRLGEYLEANGTDEVIKCYRRIQGYLNRISLNVDLSTWHVVDDLATNTWLDRLPSSLSACYNSAQAIELKRGPCTKGTRVDLLGQMLSWVNDSTPGSIYWISGMAGTGKTTVAYSLCERLDANRQLGASFFCSRLLPECRDVNLIIPSIAYQLARSSRPFRFVLAGVLEKDPDVHTRLPDIQFSSLLAQPLFTIKDTLPDNLTLVIDALDECDNKESTSQILDLLLVRGSALPVKFIVSSRPEPEIRDEMVKQNNQVNSRVVLHELDRCAVQVDVEIYLRAALAQMKPTEEQISRLVECTGILFIYAATAVRYISYDKFNRNPHARLANVLESSSKSENKHKELDELYSTILRAALDDPKLDTGEQQDLRLVLHTIICAQEPLTVQALSKLLQMSDTERVYVALRPLWSVLHMSGMSELVTTLHASFPDYMLDSSRSKQYYCDQRVHNQTIAGLCFDLFRDLRPQFNICGLESSYVPDDKVEGLEERVKNVISTQLFYAARYWAIHLQYSLRSPDLIQQLGEFLSTRLLLWMEVMNLKKCTGSMPELLRLIEKWQEERSVELAALIHDAWRFTSTFALGAATKSTPHIYTSMLPFWPELNPVAKHYKRRAQGLINTEGTAISRREHALLATWSFDGSIGSHAFSHDGTLIAVAVGSRLYVLNSSTGQAICSPFEAYVGRITSVQFSHDSSRIVSSGEHTIYVWSTRSGKKILGPLEAVIHSRHSLSLVTISQVAFGADGTSVISLSERHNIFLRSPKFPEFSIVIWDTLGGKRTINRPDFIGTETAIASITGTLEKPCIAFGYRRGILIYDSRGVWVQREFITDDIDKPLSKVEISSDGTRVAAVKGGNVYLWDLETGTKVLGPLRSSGSSRSPISFSPSGLHFATSSSDGIRVWDARTGNLVLGPLQGHETMESPRFSPDGTYIVCSTHHDSLYLWDARSMYTTLDPLPGHTGWVLSVQFSPDSTRLVSSSTDKTAGIWDAESGKLVLGPLERTAGPGPSLITFSSESSHITMPQNDGLVLLDAQTGKVTLGPFRRNANLRIDSVALSPNGTCIVICERWENGYHDPHNVLMMATDTGKILWSNQLHKAIFASPVFSPDGTQLVILEGLNKNKLSVYDAHNGKLLQEFSGSRFRLSPDGTQTVSIVKSRIVTQDMQTGEQLSGPLLEGHTEQYEVGTFAPDCTHIALADGRAICVWDTRTGRRVLGPVRWHTSTIVSVNFSPDGTRIVSGSRDQTIRVTDVQAVPNLAPGSSPDGSAGWSLQDNGWVVDESSKLLVWIPPNLRTLLMFPRTKLLISTRGHLRLNFEGAHMGTSWAKCYQPV